MNSVIENFKQAILGAALTPPDEVIADGAIQRFSSCGRRSRQKYSQRQISRCPVHSFSRSFWLPITDYIFTQTLITYLHIPNQINGGCQCLIAA